VQRAVDIEEKLLSKGCLSAPETEDDEIPEDPVDDAFQILDLGVVSAVLALNAARCRTLYSCRGGDQHAASYPLITLRARPYVIPLLLQCADESNCGLVNAEQGAVELYANEVSSLVSFARTLHASRADLKAHRVTTRPPSRNHVHNKQQIELF
jgi:hypothetical protein